VTESPSSPARSPQEKKGHVYCSLMSSTEYCPHPVDGLFWTFILLMELGLTIEERGTVISLHSPALTVKVSVPVALPPSVVWTEKLRFLKAVPPCTQNLIDLEVRRAGAEPAPVAAW
jgi:hypothetical protein